MGNLCASNSQLSPEEAERTKKEQQLSKDLDKQLSRENAIVSNIHKLLLLGAGESGKSTLFKQMIAIYGKGWPEQERRNFTSTVHNNVVGSIKTLIEQSDRLAEPPFSLPTRIAPELLPLAGDLNEIKAEAVVDAALAAKIKQIWLDPGIQTTYEHRAKFQLPDSAAYFFDKLDEIAQEDFIPSEQDVMRCRVRTTGIVEQEFKINDNVFRMCDVGGQRNERKKWIHCFEDVTAVLFVVALSEYDMVCFEDESMNRMEEALKLFEEISKSKWFGKTSFILFLNKSDLLAEKITKVPLSVWDPSYDGPNTFEAAADHIRSAFEQVYKTKDKDKSSLYTHTTCATDKEIMKRIFASVKDSIIRLSLKDSALI